MIKELVKKLRLLFQKVCLPSKCRQLTKNLSRILRTVAKPLKEYLEQSGQTEEQYTKKELKPAAEERIKAGLILSEIAEAEKI